MRVCMDHNIKLSVHISRARSTVSSKFDGQMHLNETFVTRLKKNSISTHLKRGSFIFRSAHQLQRFIYALKISSIFHID